MEIKIMIEKVFYNGNSFTEPIVSLKIGLLSILISLLFHMIIFFSYMAWYYPVYP